MQLAIKVVKIDSKIIISIPWSKQILGASLTEDGNHETISVEANAQINPKLDLTQLGSGNNIMNCQSTKHDVISATYKS